jgi:hypothetical protein
VTSALVLFKSGHDFSQNKSGLVPEILNLPKAAGSGNCSNELSLWGSFLSG